MKIPPFIPTVLAALCLVSTALGQSSQPYQGMIEGSYAQQKAKKTTSGKTTSAESSPEDELVNPDRWPTQVPGPKNTRLRALSEKDDVFRYQTINFQFTSEVELSEEAQESVGRLFETSYAAIYAMSKALPIERATRKRKSKNKFRAELYKTQASYVAAGGPQGSAGVFTHRSRTVKGKKKESDIVEDKVMVPFDSMAIAADGSMSGGDIDSHTLAHEIMHQFTCLNNLPVWANEGFSEYVGYLPYGDGVLDFVKNFEGIVVHGKRRMGRDGEGLKFPFTLEEFFLMTKDEMYEYMGNRVDTYYLSVMCVTYFVHMGDEAGVRAFKAYLKELLKGKKNDKKTLRKLYARLRTGEAVQKDFVESWAKQGVKVILAEPEEKGKKSRR